MKRFAAAAIFGNLLAAALCAQGSVSGTVRSKTTGEPIARASVTLRSLGDTTNSTRTSATGAGGEFQFMEAPPGRYQVMVHKSGYRAAPGGTGQVTLRDGEERTGLLVDLWPAGSISGTVMGPGDEPLPGAEVRAYALVYTEDGIAMPLAGQVESDDLGEYRIFGLDAGRYLLWAGPPRGGTPSGHFYANAAGAYYPGTTAPMQALPLDLSWGQQLQRINFRTAASPGSSVRGVVADAARQAPCAGCSVRAIQVDGEMRVALPGISKVARDGTFQLRGLTAGEYKLIAWRGGGAGTIGQVNVLLRDRAIADAGVLVGAGQDVSGEIVLEEPPEGVNTASWTPRLLPVGLDDSWPSPSGETGPDRKFEIHEAPPAVYRFELLNLPEGAYLKALMPGPRGLASPVITVGSEGPVRSVRAVVAFDGGVVGGRIGDASRKEGEAAPAANVILLPMERASSYSRARRMSIPPGGQFRFHSVAPGSYMLYALPQGSARQIFDPAVQASLRGYARAVELAARGAVNIEVVLPSGSE